MKILIISPFLPGPIDSGGKSRLFNLLKVTSQEADIHYLWLNESPSRNIENFSDFDYCQKEFYKTKFLRIGVKNNKIRKIIGLIVEMAGLGASTFTGLKKKIRKIENEIRPDIVQCEFSQTIRYCPKFKSPSILVIHEIVSQKIRQQIKTIKPKLKRLVSYLRYITFLKQEKRSKNLFDIIEVVSEEDLKKLSCLGFESSKIRIIKNGVDSNKFIKNETDDDFKNLYFIGWFDNEQNTDALFYFFNELLPKVQERNIKFELKIIGKGLPDELLSLSKKYNYKYFSYLPETDLLRETSNHILIVPLRFGGGTRLKILEAMSLGNPVLSTPLGAEGLEYTDKENILIFKSAEDFTDILSSLLLNKKLCQTIANGGRKLIEDKYDWKIIGKNQTDLYYELKKS